MQLPDQTVIPLHETVKTLFNPETRDYILIALDPRNERVNLYVCGAEAHKTHMWAMLSYQDPMVDWRIKCATRFLYLVCGTSAVIGALIATAVQVLL
jgi:hypothetical protein